MAERKDSIKILNVGMIIRLFPNPVVLPALAIVVLYGVLSATACTSVFALDYSRARDATK
jgi:hypothetical protein